MCPRARRGRKLTLVPLDEAVSYVLGHCPPTTSEACSASDALGRTLAADVVSTTTLPPWDNSAMDGFAVRSRDCVGAPTVLELVGAVMAGGSAPGPLEPGTALRIMTGARIPEGADGVCPLEEAEVEAGGAKVRVTVPVSTGSHVRRAGDDVRVGDVLAASGTLVTPALVGLLEATGASGVRCYRVPVVGVLSTGDELLAGNRPPGSLTTAASGTSIRDSNRAALLATLALDRVPTVDFGVVPDSTEALASAVDTAIRRCDALITTGGVSVGDRDIVRLLLERRPAIAQRWMQVAIKPAKPFAFALFNTGHDAPPMPLFGLPGNPVSALVSYELFVRPALRQMAGHAIVQRPVVKARCAAPIPRRPDGKLHLVASVVRLSSGSTTPGSASTTPGGSGDPGSGQGGAASAVLEVHPNPRQGSHVLSSLSAANALCLVPDGDSVEPGTVLDVMLLDPASCWEAPDRAADRPSRGEKR